eukprot:CAMPEP_0180783820 /NCGR_PEP_ID=MMETSP1038_2-20121128/49236_1 /TAXON_ID=632150 /ORGANISM="Azadinium spinosum, Strain 3D9" /LENGTH=225 /DNA_ID=CAMNT_0022820431 /DNA_START=92 /DNA_END=765 /DNA_ORIENTATION=-
MAAYYGLSFERMNQGVHERKLLVDSVVSIGLLPQDYREREEQDFARRRRRHREEIADWSVDADWALVRAAVVGGLYPNVIRVERIVPHKPTREPMGSARFLRYAMFQRHHSQRDALAYARTLDLHPSSLLTSEGCFQCPFLVFFTLQETSRLYAYDVSEASPLALLLFGAPSTLNEMTGNLEIGAFAHFFCPTGDRALRHVEAARQAVERVLAQKLLDPALDHTT